MSTLAIVLAVALTIRVTKLLVSDGITYPVRARIVVKLGPDHKLAYFVNCPWCVSVWVGAGAATLAWYFPTNPVFVIAGVTALASYLTGLLATHLEPDED